MIYTSSYDKIKSQKFNTISISWDKGKDANYFGDNISILAPKLSFWRIWKNNRDIISSEENNKYYIEEYYKQVLACLDPCYIFNTLNNKVMLCYEDNMDFCHRHIVSAWLELFLDIEIAEVVENNGKLVVVNKPLYIKKYLEQVIKRNMNMNHFNSIRAAYLYNLSGSVNDSQLSDILLYEASNIEDDYNLGEKIYKK